jgi:REP element-mobilizing transposase RayT
MQDRPVRRSIRLKGFDYRSTGAYFVTICTFKRLCLFGEVADDAVMLTAVGRIVESGWRAIPAFFPQVNLGLFIVMPNHLHGIIDLEDVRAKHPHAADASPLHRSRPKGTGRGSVSAVMQSFKATAARRVRSIPGMDDLRLWQRGFHDHVVRNAEDLDRIRRYIEENPLRWALDEENPARGQP